MQIFPDLWNFVDETAPTNFRPIHSVFLNDLYNEPSEWSGQEHQVISNLIHEFSGNFFRILRPHLPRLQCWFFVGKISEFALERWKMAFSSCDLDLYSRFIYEVVMLPPAELLGSRDKMKIAHLRPFFLECEGWPLEGVTELLVDGIFQSDIE